MANGKLVMLGNIFLHQTLVRTKHDFSCGHISSGISIIDPFGLLN